MLFVDEYIPIPCLAILHIHDHLISVLQAAQLNPRPDLLLSSKPQHLLDLPRRADAAAADLRILGDERKGREARQIALGRAHLHEQAAVREQLEVAVERHARVRHGAHDQVQRRGAGVRPAGVLVGGDEARGAHGERVGALRGTAADGDEVGRAQRRREQHAEVAQPPQPDDADARGRARAVPPQRAEHRDAGAQQRRGVGAGQRRWDAHAEVRRRPHVVGEAAVAGAAALGFRVWHGVGGDHVRAVVLVARGALRAVGLQA